MTSPSTSSTNSGGRIEELRCPIAPDIYAAIDRNAVYRPTASNDIVEQC